MATNSLWDSTAVPVSEQQNLQVHIEDICWVKPFPDCLFHTTALRSHQLQMIKDTIITPWSPLFSNCSIPLLLRLTSPGESRPTQQWLMLEGTDWVLHKTDNYSKITVSAMSPFKNHKDQKDPKSKKNTGFKQFALNKFLHEHICGDVKPNIFWCYPKCWSQAEFVTDLGHSCITPGQPRSALWDFSLNTHPNMFELPKAISTETKSFSWALCGSNITFVIRYFRRSCL